MLRRGFKTEANRTSREVRGELGLTVAAPLCPMQLATLLGVQLVRLSDFLTNPETAEYAGYLLGSKGQNEFSAMTVCIGGQRIVIYNDACSPGRIAASIAHELSHILLMHPPHRLCAESGGRHYDPELEAEASWLGPALLVSEEAALLIARRGLSIAEAAVIHGVSESLMRMRLNTTGALRRAA